MELTLNNRTALITGASLGIGFAIAEAFYSAGARVAIVARREDKLAEAKARIRTRIAPEGAQIETWSGDVEDAATIARIHREVEAALGPVDILVNNAGRAAVKPFMSITDEEWRSDIEFKLMAAIRLSRLVWPAMQEQRWGRIINILNIGAKTPGARSAPTTVTRAAGMALTKVMSAEGAPHNILVNALLIGQIRSDQIRRTHETLGSNQTLDEYVTEFGKRLPMGRMGEAEEVANLGLFLASDASSYVTGCAINMDGGLSPAV
jgi:NAD(P)-dependent dehydrogenase (short-subunit alcohol dehydrogenase family)